MQLYLNTVNCLIIVTALEAVNDLYVHGLVYAIQSLLRELAVDYYYLTVSYDLEGPPVH